MIAALLLACASEPVLEDYAAAWCSYRETCCPVEHTDAPTDCNDASAGETCEADWLGVREGCVVVDPEALDACLACYETADLYNVEELGHSCLSNVSAICADACTPTLDCPESL